jgi:hypothetical protein
MTAPIRIEAKAIGDTRFKILARLCGFADGDHALIKCARIWAYQTDIYTDDRPSYVVSAEVIEAELGPGGAEHLVTARLATREPGGEPGGEPAGFRIHGTEGRIEWLYRSRQNGKSGGRPPKKPAGYPPGIPPAPPDENRPPPPLTLTLGSESDEPVARARDPGVPDAGAPAPEHGGRVPPPPPVLVLDPQARRRSEILRAIAPMHAEVYNRVRREIGSNAKALQPLGDVHETALRKLLESLPSLDGVEERCRHVLDVRAAEARRSGSVEYLGASVWSANAYARALSVDDAAQARAAGARPERRDEPRRDEPRPVKQLNSVELP